MKNQTALQQAWQALKEIILTIILVVAVGTVMYYSLTAPDRDEAHPTKAEEVK